MINSTKLLIFLLILAVNFNQFAHSALYKGSSNPKNPTTLDKYFSHYNQRIIFNKTCTKPEIIHTKLFSSNCLKDGLAIDKVNGKYGYVDKDGNNTIDYQYDEAYRFSDGLAMVGVSNNESATGIKFGYIDKMGKFIIPPKYKLGQDFSEGLIGVVNDELKYGFIDLHGKTVLPFIYDVPFDFTSPNSSDNMIYSVHSYIFHDNIALVKLKGKWQFIDKKGNTMEFIK